jgi:hypothetical protein
MYNIATNGSVYVVYTELEDEPLPDGYVWHSQYPARHQAFDAAERLVFWDGHKSLSIEEPPRGFDNMCVLMTYVGG